MSLFRASRFDIDFYSFFHDFDSILVTFGLHFGSISDKHRSNFAIDFLIDFLSKKARLLKPRACWIPASRSPFPL